MVVTFQTIEFFDISKISQNETILLKEPRFVFKKNESGFGSAIFNPSNTHIIATSRYDCCIEIWSIRKPSIQKIVCEYIPLNMKWHAKGYLLGFMNDCNNLKIYNILQKKEIFNLYFNDSISQFEFYGNDSILACNENKNRIFQYNFDPEPKEDLKIKDKNN
jgi:WD40 repeat protein